MNLKNLIILKNLHVWKNLHTVKNLHVLKTRSLALWGLFGVLTIGWAGPARAQDCLTLLFAGDLMQHQAQIDAARTGPSTYDYSTCFQHVRAEIERADVAIGNLEVTLGGPPYRGYPAFSAPDAYLHAIQAAGFDVLLTANNHCLDRGAKGLQRTLAQLDSVGMAHAGTYVDTAQREATYPLLVEKKGFRLAILNYTYGTNGLQPRPPYIVNYIDKEQMRTDILKARRMCPDVIVACMHWGVEYRSFPERAERELADWLLEQGVDHVIGSHPHVLQPVEVKRDARTPARHVVAYSLGNFLSNMSQEKTDGGMLLKLELQRVFRITRLVDCSYALVWTARPAVSGKKNFELYPATFVEQSLRNQEAKWMERFLEGTRRLFGQYNQGTKEYFFE